ncbi:MAG: hypothetical protein UV43_C0014G0015 [Parcubacteria group bacterium GW2011_GWF2_42_7]|nr:MAG: hypothetical protein UU96_C0018G0002 [Parcubacteria group bacterium GW2011_GWC2_42_13]KKS72639.1 MAG: hypothetical protein UV43_C0014G0015 [Parcubacteria group bacterium GW2011_GWF2_42_7]
MSRSNLACAERNCQIQNLVVVPLSGTKAGYINCCLPTPPLADLARQENSEIFSKNFRIFIESLILAQDERWRRG